jgi:7-cyano-7-deazaguanine synthase
MRSIVVFSGGMDSTTLLARSLLATEDVLTLSFDYGSKHNAMEQIAIANIAAYYGVPNIRISLPEIGKHFKSDLLMSGGEIPEGHYEDLSMKRTVVPFRNGIMLAYAIGLAESLDRSVVWIGAHAGDHAIYPDCRSEFIHTMNSAAIAGTYSQVKVDAPFMFSTKRDIALLGRDLDVPFRLTYSCYNGKPKHCGRCGTCVERKEALEGFDPTEYES